MKYLLIFIFVFSLVSFAESNTNVVDFSNNLPVPKGSFFKLKITGYDKSYRIGDSPNTFLVYQRNRKSKVIREFVIIGINPAILEKLRPGESKNIVVQVIKDKRLKMPDGNIKAFPLLKVVGKNTIHGVGGELMYWK
jgi:hypothetical protein